MVIGVPTRAPSLLQLMFELDDGGSTETCLLYLATRDSIGAKAFRLWAPPFVLCSTFRSLGTSPVEALLIFSHFHR